jgi:tetratricopeptide (TPR) repeat protein
MRLTSSFAVFRFDPGERDLAKARWFGREGKVEAAEQEYRAALRRKPDVVAAWCELFELLRRDGRHPDALAVATQAGEHFGPDAAMPLALRGAAFAELGRTRDAVEALEAALERDGNLALAWHELAYTAYRTGEYSRALLALDRAFTLEPHTDSLMLRGRILRESGQYDAAEVAFEGAMQSAEHDIPRHDAEREIQATRRAASLGGRRPRRFTPRERAFADAGCIVLDDGADPAEDLPVVLARALAVLPVLVREIGWHPAAVAWVLAADAPLAQAVATAVGAQLVAAAALDPADRPLIVTAHNDRGEEWGKQIARLGRWHGGYSFALIQSAASPDTADVVGTLRPVHGSADAYLAAQAALEHPQPAVPPADEVAELACSHLATWRRRIAIS